MTSRELNSQATNPLTINNQQEPTKGLSQVSLSRDNPKNTQNIHNSSKAPHEIKILAIYTKNIKEDNYTITLLPLMK